MSANPIELIEAHNLRSHNLNRSMDYRVTYRLVSIAHKLGGETQLMTVETSRIVFMENQRRC
jgi:hypothetical protein